jgi:hypothetical protein
MRIRPIDSAFPLLAIACTHCGTAVQPSVDVLDVVNQDHSADTAIADRDLDDSSNDAVDAASDAQPDAPRLRHLSTVSIWSGQASVADSVGAKFLSDEVVASSIDSTEGPCRTLFSEMLPETPAGTLTVERPGERLVIEPATSRPRNLYTTFFAAGSPPGLLFTVRAAGSSTFPAFVLEARTPPALTITRPATRTEPRWDSSMPLTIEWQPDESDHYVRLALSGATMASGTALTVRCTIPIGVGRFTFQPERLRRLDVFPFRRRIDVNRVAIASGVFANAPVQLTVANAADGIGWIQFPPP